MDIRSEIPPPEKKQKNPKQKQRERYQMVFSDEQQCRRQQRKAQKNTELPRVVRRHFNVVDPQSVQHRGRDMTNNGRDEYPKRCPSVRRSL